MTSFLRKILLFCILVQANNVFSRDNAFQPSGIRWGSFTISPLVENENEYDSNLFKTSINQKDDYIVHVKPSVNVRSNWSRHAIDLTVRSDIGLHQNYEQEDFEDVFIDLSGRLDVLRDSYATTKFYWSKRHEERGEIDNGGINGPVEYSTIGGIFEYEHQFNRLRVNVSNDISYLDYSGLSSLDGFPAVKNSLRNRYIDTATAQLPYEVNPRLDAFIRGEYNFKDYDSSVDRSAFIPPALDPLNPAAGIGFNRDSDGFEIVSGVGFDFTGMLFGDVYFGYREQYFDDPMLQDVSGITGGASLKWLATPLTTVSMAIDNDIIETTQAGASAGVSTDFKLNIDHELLRYVLLNAHGGYTMNNFEGSTNTTGVSSREDEYIVLGFKAKYLYSRNFYLKGEYLYRERNSNIPLNDYDSHRVLLSIGLQL
jgi:hypothetical protein